MAGRLRVGATLVEQGRVDIPASREVLELAAGRALVATTVGLAFVDVPPTGMPTVVGEMALPERPTSTLSVGDRLLVGGEHGVAVVRPPCGP